MLSFLRRHGLITKQYWSSKVVDALFAIVVLALAGSWISTMTIAGWLFGAFFVIGAIVLFLRG